MWAGTGAGRKCRANVAQTPNFRQARNLVFCGKSDVADKKMVGCLVGADGMENS